jgi:hypothetical protein
MDDGGWVPVVESSCCVVDLVNCAFRYRSPNRIAINEFVEPVESVDQDYSVCYKPFTPYTPYTHSTVPENPKIPSGEILF